MKRILFSLLIVTGFLPTRSFAQATDGAADDEALVRAIGTAYVEAFNKHDADALAAMWSPQAVYTNRITGEQVVGRDAIAEQFKAIFKDAPELKLSVDVESIRFLSPNVAVENGTAKSMTPKGEPDEVHYGAVYVKSDGKWLLDRVNDEEPDAATPYDQLQALEWLVGRWIDQDDKVRIETECHWAKNRNFLIRSFTVEAGDQIDMSGMQVIGWDGADKKIRSWTFDSDGGFAEAVWSKTGDRWFISNKGVTADGDKATMVNVIKPVDENSFTWQTLERTVGGELLPNVAEVLIVREK